MKIYLSIILFLCTCHCSFGQDFNTPLHVFFQKNADSTIFYSFDNYSSPDPYFLILSKKGDTLSAFTYKAKKITEDRSNLPFNIRYALFLRDRFGITKVPVAVNAYFNPVFLSRDSLFAFWQSVSKQDIWTIKDDLQDGGEGCPKIKNGQDISDGGGITFQLITKQEIRKLHFYAPAFYEKQCPGRKGRKAAINIEMLFSRYFKE